MSSQNIPPTTPGIPIADITIDGLAICNFKECEYGLEVAFLRFEDHTLGIIANLPDSDDPIVREVKPSVSELLFQLDYGSNAHYDDYTEGYFALPLIFSRKDMHNDELGGMMDNDFRWVIDFTGDEMPHGKFLRLKEKKDFPKRVDVTLATIPNALFYTKEVSDDLVILSPHKKNNPNYGFVLGPSNGTIGAIVFAEKPGDFKIIDPKGIMEPIVLSYREGHVHQVAITNMDMHTKIDLREKSAKLNFVKGDFDRYYEVIEVSGDPYDLWAPARSEAHLKSGDNEGRLGDCHVVRVGSAVDTLRPLL